MKKNYYIKRSLRHYFRQHLVLILGTILSTAVITSGLIVGDSVRFSLNKILDARLGKVNFVLQTNERFVGSDLANRISEQLKIHSSALLTMNGMVINPQNENRIHQTQIVGFESDFNAYFEKKMPELSNDEAIVSQNLAQRLNLKAGDDVIVKLEKLSIIPINSPYGKEKESPQISLRLRIKTIADAGSFEKFSLRNSQISPYNIFVSRRLLESELEISNASNVLVFSANENCSDSILNRALRSVWNLKDAGLEVKKLNENGNYEIVSDRIFMDKPISKTILSANPESKKILSYLVNSVGFQQKYTPYSFVTAVSDNFIGTKIQANKILINDWLAQDLNAKKGDSLTLRYFVIDRNLDLNEDSSVFVVKDIFSVNNPLIDKSLMPNFPGFTQAISCMDWNTNAPIDMKKIRDKDEKYWADFRGTPKAIIGIEDGIRIWQNPFGELTSIRFTDSIHNKKQVDSLILSLIQPADLNFSVQEVKKHGQFAANTGVDFGELFLSLSFFVLLAAMLLTILLFNLHLNSRKTELGILLSVGFSKKEVLKFKVFEYLIPAFFASLFGILLGVLFSKWMIWAMNSVWIDMIRTSMMEIKIQTTTILIGGLSGLLLSMLSMYFVLRKFLKNTSIQLINNSFNNFSKNKSRHKKLRFSASVFSFTLAISILFYSFLITKDTNPMLFMISGTLILVGFIYLILFLFNTKSGNSNSNLSISKLIFKGLIRNKVRNISVILLLAMGVFVVIVTAGNRKGTTINEHKRTSGTGGYDLWMESSIPILENLNNPESLEKLGFEKNSVLKTAHFIQFLSKKGDDASCLNLNHIEMPEILGVDAKEFDNRTSFSFENLGKNISDEHPWLELEKTYDSLLIPAFADQTVITWGLLKKLGDTLNYTAENGKQLKLILVGGLNSSIFQGKILISATNFHHFFPSIAGFEICLIDATEKPDEMSKLLNSQLQDYGIEIQKTSDRLNQFSSVSNIYLQVFMLLGALGILIATFGIGIILYRNLLDSRHEIAMMLALGFTKKHIFQIYFIQNGLVIFTGISIGMISSLIGILPAMISSISTFPTLIISLIIFSIFLNSLIWSWILLKFTFKRDVLSGLRME